ncbi:MAG: Radical SAM domain protein [Berkelbacteria bacterium GW2011_GWA1_36_9]|uniref:Radical SAM domain protein n=1 Tax=Berkelbacteria bacterium GW2011_GWA1_36_9 TaxID=1618331 RepID=A0A0G0FHV9_9BACT|nr:MAG: Radical SAM domain protein [Berkelbacteria bacterium GW2011_GWA1_36_9]
MDTPKFANIDLLDIGNSCNLDCRQCFYVSPGARFFPSIGEQLDRAKAVVEKFPGSSLFLYPKEICTSLFLLDMIQAVGQHSVLSNGILLSDRVVEKLAAHGIEEVKVTLYASYKEQKIFYGITEEQYRQIIENIARCTRRGLRVIVNSTLSKITKYSLHRLANLCRDLEVERIEFLRLMPLGKAKNLDRTIFLDEADMIKIIGIIEEYKLRHATPRFRYYLNCGPDFHRKTPEEIRRKIAKGRSIGNAQHFYLCPAINRDYLCVSLVTGKISGCLFAKIEPIFDQGSIDFTTGQLKLEPPVLRHKILSEKLRGNCRAGNCKYHKQCLGGCRSTAFAVAKFANEKNPLYAGMDICVTKCKEKLGL